MSGEWYAVRVSFQVPQSKLDRMRDTEIIYADSEPEAVTKALHTYPVAWQAVAESIKVLGADEGTRKALPL